MPLSKKREKSEEPPEPREQKPEGLARLVSSYGELEKQVTGRIRTDEEVMSGLSIMQTLQMRRYLSRYWKMKSQQQTAEQDMIGWQMVQIDLKIGAYAKQGLHMHIPKLRREADYWDSIARVISQQK